MHPALTSTLTYMRRHALLLLLALLVVLFGITYALGYRPGPDLTFVRVGTLTLSGMPKGSIVYVDQTKRATSIGKDVKLALEPGSHSVIADMPGDYPWSDVVTITTRADTKASPIIVPMSVVRTPVPDTTTANTVLSTYKLPDAANPIIMENGCAIVSVENNRVLASPATATGCTPPPFLCIGGTCATTVVFAPIAPLRAVLPYPGRQDAVIVSYGSTLAVLELNPLKPQFFAPLLQGIQPAAALYDAKDIVVRDAGKTFLIGF